MAKPDIFQHPVYEVFSSDGTPSDLAPVLLLVKDTKTNSVIELHLTFDDAKAISSLLLKAIPSLN